MKARTVSDGLFVSRRVRSTIDGEDLGFHPLFRLVSAEVDESARSVSSSFLGTGLGRARSIFVEGLGTVLLCGEPETVVRERLRLRAPARSAVADAPWPGGAVTPDGTTPAGPQALLRELLSSPEERERRTRALLVVQDSKILAERYAGGAGPDTPLQGWSMGKSVVALLVGTLVARGLLDLHAPLGAPEWRERGDPRGSLSFDHLLRMSSGLAWREAYEKDPVSDVQRMLFLVPDAAAYAASKPLEAEPDTLWRYSSGSTNIICRALRDFFPDLASYLDFPRRELFSRIGMRSAHLATDASGTFVGSSFIHATARDWARFGLLCLQDGVWEGRRLLPPGWMDYLTTPAPAAPRGEYGASFWLNRGLPGDPELRLCPALPPDLYYASGHQGQQLFVLPSRRLVVVRLGVTYEGDWGAGAFLPALLQQLPP